MDFNVSRPKIFAFFISIITVFFACTKITNTDIGSGLIPPVDGVNTKDTVLNIITKNKAFDTVSVGFSDDHVLGFINDPVFGKTTASINFQVEPPSAPLTFGVSKDSLMFDSVVLSLHYTGVWGDSMSHLTLHVFEMDPENKFTVDSSYNNTISFEKGTELTEGFKSDVNIITLNDPDTLATYNEDATNQLRIRLNAAFGEKLLTQFDATNAYQNDSTFNTYFRGFIVEPEQQGNALIKINLSDTSTRLSLYYHYINTSGTLDTAVRRFSPTALNSATSNTIIRNYQGSSIPNYIPSNTNAQDSLIYIQTSPGTFATLNIPGLSGLQNMIVHRAEILMQQVPDIAGMSDGNFTSPNLFVSAYDPDSMRRFAIPYDVIFSSGTISNLTTFGVYPIKKTDRLSGQSVSNYSFDISRYVQGVVTRKDTAYNLVLWAPYNAYISDNLTDLRLNYVFPIASPALNPVAIGRVRLGGGNNAQYKMRLHIVYSAVQ